MLAPLSCSTPPPLTLSVPALCTTALTSRAGVQGATVTPLNWIGFTKIEAALPPKSRVPPSVARVDGLALEAVIPPVRVRVPPVLTVAEPPPPALLRFSPARVLSPNKLRLALPLTVAATPGAIWP